MREINKVILHCSDSDVKSHDNIETIRKWHVQENGWENIGYHLFIDKKGKIWKGRPFGVIGAHCESQNIDSIGVCVSGKKEFTDAQFQSLKIVCSYLMMFFDLKPECFKPHNFYDKTKTCPNFNLEPILTHLMGFQASLESV